MGVWNVHAKREGMVGVNESVRKPVSQSVRKLVSNQSLVISHLERPVDGMGIGLRLGDPRASHSQIQHLNVKKNSVLRGCGERMC